MIPGPGIKSRNTNSLIRNLPCLLHSQGSVLASGLCKDMDPLSQVLRGYVSISNGPAVQAWEPLFGSPTSREKARHGRMQLQPSSRDGVMRRSLGLAGQPVLPNQCKSPSPNKVESDWREYQPLSSRCPCVHAHKCIYTTTPNTHKWCGQSRQGYWQWCGVEFLS